MSDQPMHSTLQPSASLHSPTWLSHIRWTYVAAVIIGLGVILRLPMLPEPLTYATDYWRPADTAAIAHHFLENGFRLLYPQINWGGSGPGYVETEFQLYPFLVALLYRVFGEQLWLGRLVSLLFSVPTFAVFYLLARRILTPLAATVALFLFVISPLDLRYSATFMPEAAMLFFYVVALYLFYRYYETSSRWLLALAALSTALGILIKPTAGVVFLVFLILMFDKHGVRGLIRREVWLTGLVSLVPSALWYWHAHELYLTYGNTFGVIGGGDTKFGNLSYWLSPAFYLATARLEVKWVFDGVGLVFFVIGLIAALRHRRYILITAGVLTTGLYYLAIAHAADKPFAVHYHLVALPFAALAMGLGISTLTSYARMTGPLTAGAAVLLFLTVAWSAYIYGDLVRFGENGWARQEINCAAQVQSVVPDNSLLIISSPVESEYADRPRNYQDPTIFFYSHRYGWSLPADWHTPDKVEAYHQAGAAYFVIADGPLLESSPTLVSYLEANSVQIGPGIAAGCGVYQLH